MTENKYVPLVPGDVLIDNDPRERKGKRVVVVDVVGSEHIWGHGVPGRKVRILRRRIHAAPCNLRRDYTKKEPT